jgi:hypothetical protein
MSGREDSYLDEMELLEAGLSTLALARRRNMARNIESTFSALTLRGKHTPSKKQKASLMTIPAELRLEIFDYVLRPGEVYVRWSARAAHHDIRFSHILEEWDSDPDPSNWLTLQSARVPKSPRSPPHAETQLFLVSKQFSYEATHHYLTKNTFHIMGVDHQLPYLS